jgi:hypothetical protein
LIFHQPWRTLCDGKAFPRSSSLLDRDRLHRAAFGRLAAIVSVADGHFVHDDFGKIFFHLENARAGVSTQTASYASFLIDDRSHAHSVPFLPHFEVRSGSLAGIAAPSADLTFTTGGNLSQAFAMRQKVSE